MNKYLAAALVVYSMYSFMPNMFAEEPAYRYQSVTVKAGDTLWEIAAKNVENGQDVHAVIDKICLENKLENRTIHPGQVIKVPVKLTQQDYMLARK